MDGRPAPKVKLPYGPVLAMAYINEFWAKHLSHGTPRMSVTAVRMAKKFMYFDSAKAVSELGLPQTPARQALAEAVEWFKQNGYV